MLLIGKILSYSKHMQNMKALSLMVWKKRAMFIFFKNRSKVTCSKLITATKSLVVTKKKHAINESPVSYSKKVMGDVEVFQMFINHSNSKERKSPSVRKEALFSTGREKNKSSKSQGNLTLTVKRKTGNIEYLCYEHL